MTLSKRASVEDFILKRSERVFGVNQAGFVCIFLMMDGGGGVV